MSKNKWLCAWRARSSQNFPSPDGRAKPRSARRADGRRFWSSDKGNVAIMFALTLPILAGGAGLGVETSYWYYKDLQIQAAADAAAFAGAIEKRAGSTDGEVLASATSSAVENYFDPTKGSIAVNTPPLTGPNTGNTAVEVLITQPLQRFFSKIFVNGPVIVNARAVARYQTSSSACVLALDPSASRSVLFSGTANMTLTGCTVMANSIAPDAITSQGSSVLTVDCLISSGGVDLTATETLTECPGPIVDAAPVADPYKDVPVPTASGSCLHGGGPSRSPGRYCGGLSLAHDTVLAPGVYHISGGDFRVEGIAEITGQDVTIYLEGDARVRINGTATVDLTAPTTGVYAGMLFFGDRSNSESEVNIFNGTAASNLTGALYFASQKVTYAGDYAGTDGCTRIVAGVIDWTGNTTFDQDCTHLGLADIPSLQLVRIAE